MGILAERPFVEPRSGERAELDCAQHMSPSVLIELEHHPGIGGSRIAGMDGPGETLGCADQLDRVGIVVALNHVMPSGAGRVSDGECERNVEGGGRHRGLDGEGCCRQKN